MRAIEITKPGGPKVLKLTDRPIPKPRYGEILIKVAAAGINRPDALQRAGLYNPPVNASDLPGLECAGTVEAVGDGVSQWKKGDQVCALLPGGGYAEYVTTPASHALPIPDGLTMVEAAAIPETFFTVYSTVFMRGALKAGETFLVHGGSSGIGTTAIQLAKKAGARVFATAGSDEKCKICEDLGAEKAFNYKTTDFVAEMKPHRPDLILDMVGGDYIPRNIKTLKDDGRIVQIAFLQGPKVELNFAQIMLRRLTITGATLRPHGDLAKAKIAQNLKTKIWPLLNSGQIAPVIDSTYKLEDAAKAHAHMETSNHIGKLILTL